MPGGGNGERMRRLAVAEVDERELAGPMPRPGGLKPHRHLDDAAVLMVLHLLDGTCRAPVLPDAAEQRCERGE